MFLTVSVQFLYISALFLFGSYFGYKDNPNQFNLFLL